MGMKPWSPNAWKPFKLAQASSTWFRAGDWLYLAIRLFRDFPALGILSYLLPTSTLVDVFHAGLLCATLDSTAVEIHGLGTRCASRCCANFVWRGTLVECCAFERERERLNGSGNGWIMLWNSRLGNRLQERRWMTPFGLWMDPRFGVMVGGRKELPGKKSIFTATSPLRSWICQNL